MAKSIRGLSLWEPWASLVALGAKSLETRSWKSSYRGPLLICSAKRRDPGAMSLLESPPFQAALAPLLPPGKPPRPVVPADLNFGNAVALVDLADCLPVEDVPPESLEREGLFGDYSPGRYAWVLHHLRLPLQPYPQKGAQGLFKISLTSTTFSEIPLPLPDKR